VFTSVHPREARSTQPLAVARFHFMDHPHERAACQRWRWRLFLSRIIRARSRNGWQSGGRLLRLSVHPRVRGPHSEGRRAHLSVHPRAATV